MSNSSSCGFTSQIEEHTHVHMDGADMILTQVLFFYLYRIGSIIRHTFFHMNTISSMNSTLVFSFIHFHLSSCIIRNAISYGLLHEQASHQAVIF